MKPFQAKNAGKVTTFVKPSPAFSKRDDICARFNWQELTVSPHAERSSAPVAYVEIYNVIRPDFKQTTAFLADVCSLAQTVTGPTFDAFDGILHWPSSPW